MLLLQPRTRPSRKSRPRQTKWRELAPDSREMSPLQLIPACTVPWLLSCSFYKPCGSEYFRIIYSHYIHQTTKSQIYSLLDTCTIREKAKPFAWNRSNAKRKHGEAFGKALGLPLHENPQGSMYSIIGYL